jgi:hypothetical protein
MLKKDDRTKQLVYYPGGIGKVLETPIVASVSELWDEMVAYNLEERIKGLSLPRVPPSHRA